MSETIEQTIKRLEFCRDCIDRSYEAGRMEYERLERMISELKTNKYGKTNNSHRLRKL